MRYAVLFDFNGVIADDEPIHFEAAKRALAASGFDLTGDEYYGPLFGLSDELFFREFLKRRGIDDEALAIRLVAHKSLLYAELVERSDVLFCGVRELIEELCCRAILGIVSAAQKDEIESILNRYGLADRFRFVVAADDITRHKPDPEAYQLALEKLEEIWPAYDKRRIVAIEDSAAGVAAAKAAGLKVIAVAHYIDPSKLNAADTVVEHISNISAKTVESVIRK